MKRALVPVAALLLLITIFAEASDKGLCPSLPPISSSVPRHTATPSPLPDKTYIGTVSLDILVSDTGYVCDARVVHGIDKKLNADAVRAAKRWKFEPGRKNGRGVPVEMLTEIQFWRNKDGQVIMLNAPEGGPVKAR